jgi:hypothetical protein
MKIQNAIAYLPWVFGAFITIFVFGKGRAQIETVPCLVASRDFGHESLQVSVTTPADPADADHPGKGHATAARSEPVRGFEVVDLQIPNADMRRAVVRADRCAHLIGTKLSRYVKKGDVLLNDHIELRPPSQGPSYEVFPVLLDKANNAKTLEMDRLRIGRSITFVRDVNRPDRNPAYKILDFDVRSETNNESKALVNLMLESQADGMLSEPDREFVDAVRGKAKEAFIDAYLD